MCGGGLAGGDAGAAAVSGAHVLALAPRHACLKVAVALQSAPPAVPRAHAGY